MNHNWNYWIRVWDLKSERQITIETPSHYWLALAFSPNGKTLVSGGSGQVEQSDQTARGEIKTWNALSGEETGAASGLSEPVSCIAFCPAGDLFASAGSDVSVRLWNASTLKQRARLDGHPGGTTWVTFAPDGKTVASAGRDGLIRLWDFETLKEKCTLPGHRDTVNCVAFSADGKTLASSGTTGSGTSIPDVSEIKLWDPETGQERATLVGHTREVTQLAFSPNGHVLASLDGDTIRLWGDVIWQPEQSKGAFPLSKSPALDSGVSNTPTVSDIDQDIEPSPVPELPSADLHVLVADLPGPVHAGTEFTYEVRVDNNGAVSESQVVLVATLPAGMAVERVGTAGPTEYRIDDQTIRFAPVEEVLPGTTLRYRIRVHARKPGTFTLRVEFTSPNLPEPVIVEETTQVLE
jgi:uncharacterized repeat protein (TIGR01451 family)